MQSDAFPCVGAKSAHALNGLRVIEAGDFTSGEYDAAIEMWKQAIEVRRGSVGHLQIAGALIKAGRLDEAAAVLESAIPSNPGAEAHRRLAEVYAALGRTAESERERRTYTEQRLEELRLGG